MVHQDEPGRAAAEQLPEASIEGRLERSERRLELVRDQGAELVDEAPGSLDRNQQVCPLHFERLEPSLERLVFLDGERVGGAKLEVAASQRRDAAWSGWIQGR